jgi:sugar/nucleoside kinase (ribokinase family)
MKKYDILVVGDYCLDFIFTGLESMPELGKEIVGSGFIQTPGGACNSVIAMQRLGLKVGWLTNFGKDDYSKFILGEIRKEGISEEYFMFHDRPHRKVTVSLSYPHERAFIAYYDPDPLVTSEICNLPKASGKALYVPGFYLGRELDLLLPLIKTKKWKLIMDGNTNEAHTLKEKRVVKVLKALDVFLCNAREARSLTGEQDLEIAIRILGKLVPEVVIKNGAEGSIGWQAGQITLAPAINVKPIDTTGAGDCFDAGFIKIWISGGTQMEALKWGNIVGGLSTTASGGVGRMIRCDDVEKYLGEK